MTWAKELPGRMLKLPIRVSGCLDRLEIHCCDIPVILEQVRWGAGSTCSRFCGHVIIFLNHHIAIKPISPETAAKHCFAPGNEEKEIPGRPRFDIISRWNIGRIAWIGIPVRSVESRNTFVNYLTFQFFWQAFSLLIKPSFLVECHERQGILHESHDNFFMSCDNFLCSSRDKFSAAHSSKF